MKKIIKSALRSFLRLLGYRIIRLRPNEYGYSLEYDIAKLLEMAKRKADPLVIFDVGANEGQSVSLFKRIQPQSLIHTFEPDKTAFAHLQEKTKRYSGVVHNAFGLGAQKGESVFYANQQSDISSFLEPTQLLWGRVEGKQIVQVDTIDQYLFQNRIPRVNYLKIDTQGFDLEVLKGAAGALRDRKIDIIQMEITIAGIYHNLPRMDAVLKFLFDLDYGLVAFYDFHSQHAEARWTDALFISPEFIRKGNPLSQA